jgi:hypothetical protein
MGGVGQTEEHLLYKCKAQVQTPVSPKKENIKEIDLVHSF